MYAGCRFHGLIERETRIPKLSPRSVTASLCLRRQNNWGPFAPPAPRRRPTSGTKLNSARPSRNHNRVSSATHVTDARLGIAA